MYAVEVSDQIMIAHSFRGAVFGPAQELHGATFVVRVAFFFLELKELDDTKGEFEAITDMRLHWSDLRLAFPLQESPRGYKEYRGAAAEK